MPDGIPGLEDPLEGVLAATVHLEHTPGNSCEVVEHGSLPLTMSIRLVKGAGLADLRCYRVSLSR